MAKKNGAARKVKPMQRTGTVVQRDGRELPGLSAAIGVMRTERGMFAPAAGSSVFAQPDDITTAAASELTEHGQAAGGSPPPAWAALRRTAATRSRRRVTSARAGVSRPAQDSALSVVGRLGEDGRPLVRHFPLGMIVGDALEREGAFFVVGHPLHQHAKEAKVALLLFLGATYVPVGPSWS
ncbi:hypothetical protein ACH4FX_04650 [Streptomyces sp. NPDC018019]|uniref:hypothetical protein n=1 Tax=Streptomyces sp. NPDC018019 TaxID=3365030 RepID=UPI0037B3DA94